MLRPKLTYGQFGLPVKPLTLLGKTETNFEQSNMQSQQLVKVKHEGKLEPVSASVFACGLELH